jgi:hypothetical protein
MSTSNPALSELGIPLELLMNDANVEELFKWFASHEPSRKEIYIKFRILSIKFRVGPTGCSIQPWYDGNEAGFLIYYHINNEMNSHKIHLFEKEKFFQYLKEYFLTPAEYDQWMKQYAEDIEKSKRLKIKHDLRKCTGPDKCLYCIHEERKHDLRKCTGPDKCRYCIDEQREHDSRTCAGPDECRYCIHEQRDECNDET